MSTVPTPEKTEHSSLSQESSKESSDVVTRRPLPKSALNRAFWHLFWGFQVSWNYERMHGLGFCWAMQPALREVYPNDDDYADALVRHMGFINTNPIVGAPVIVGAAIALEEAGAPESAEGIKAGLMGPLAGIGDTIVWALYNTIIFTIGASMALQGNIVGPILTALLVAIPYFFVRRWQFFSAYRRGHDLLKNVGIGILDKITQGATIFGLIVLGGFVPSIVKIVTTYTYTQSIMVEGKLSKLTVPFQTQLDTILPYMLPVCVTAACYWMMKKFKLSPVWVILGLTVLGVALSATGQFAAPLPPAGK